MTTSHPDTPESLDKILGAITEQVWKEIKQLPELRPEIFNGDNVTSIAREPTDGDLMRFRDHSVIGSPQPIEDAVKEAKDVLSFVVRPNHPRFISAVPSPSSPVSWLGEILTSAFNAWPAAWISAAGVSIIEIKLVDWLAAQVGMPESTGGTFVSGGSMANLSALAIARDQKLAEDVRYRGVAYYSDQTHFSIPKALRILGLIKSQMRQVPSDSDFRMDMKELRKAVAEDKAKGLVPFLVIANAGTTNTGSIDPLNDIADFVKENDMWMHVDGAYGASVALSKSFKPLVSGIERADSVAWDAHKWLFQTFGCAIVLIRDKTHMAQSFTSSGDYFRDIPNDDKQPNLYNYGIELSKPARHMKLWFSLRVFGAEILGRMIDQGMILARFAEAELRKLPGWKITSPAVLGVLSFRYDPESTPSAVADSLNSSLSSDVIKGNIAYIQTTHIAGRVSLRMCIIHPQTSHDDIRNILQSLHGFALKRALQKQ